ncbi:tetratricopeptide repeat protein [Polymorphospora sp. NPDC051019]|uniref:ATP-binding protein n=1 Tax=Polymorphospora sp. NPDC051019 TaxID=3155725 RepID=UPI00343A370A
MPIFVGQGATLAWLDEQLDRPRHGSAPTVIALDGAAGVGKTATVLVWGRTVAHRFPDGQVYVDFRGYAPEAPISAVEAMATVLRAMGIAAEQIPTTAEDAAALLRASTADRRMLLLLDNVRTVGQVRPLLSAGGPAVILVTSRARLTGLVAQHDASRRTVDPLAPAESRELLVRIIGRARADTARAPIEELARACGHLPLALRIAGANLADHPRWTTADYVAAIASDKRLARLTVEGEESIAVRVALDHSYAVLTPEEQQLFRLLGVLPTPSFDPATAAALSGATRDVTERLLDRLVAISLVEPRAGERYAFHDLVRLYSRERAQDSEPAAHIDHAWGRVLEHYLGLVDQAARLLYPNLLRPETGRAPAPSTSFADDSGKAIAWLDAERANLVAAVRHATTTRPYDGWILADGLRGYFWLQRHMVDWLAVAEAGLAAADSIHDDLGRATAHLNLATAHLCQGNYAVATRHYTLAHRGAEAADWLEGQAAAMGGLGTVNLQSGQLELAARSYRGAFEANQKLGRIANQATNLSNLGLVYLDLGQARVAADHFGAALALHREAGSVTGQSYTLTNLGESMRILGEFAQATTCAEESLALARAAAYRSGELVALGVLALIDRDTGALDRALDRARTALAGVEESGDRSSEADIRNTIGSIELLAGDHPDAEETYRVALDIAFAAGTRYQEADARIGLAETALRQGDIKAALSMVDGAIEIATATGYRHIEARARAVLAEVHRATGGIAEARTQAAQALALHEQVGHLLGIDRTRALLRRLAADETAVRDTEG